MTALVTPDYRPSIPKERPVDVDALKQALAGANSGEVRFDAQARALYATDASNYHQAPIGVVIPKSIEDVEKTVAICREYRRIIAEGGRKATIYRGLRGLVDNYAAQIRRNYPKIPRRVSGYNLDNLLPENGFHVARALVGSEGTCVTILRLKCRLVPSPPERVLLLLGYPGVYAAGDAVAQIRAAGPVGLEGMDRKLMQYLKRKKPDEKDSALLPEGNAWLLVEFGGDTADQAEKQARALMAELRRAKSRPTLSLVCDPKTQGTLWKLRGAALGVIAHVPHIGATHEGWEDSAVPPERLGDYLRDFHALLARYQYETALYGHFGDGCVHCRINFDLATPDGVAKYRRFIGEAADIVISYGGSLSGEHGDGQSRAALLDKMFGPELIQAFRTYKRLWDPDWKMNPDKVVLAYLPTENLREGPGYRPWSPATRFAFLDEERDFAKAANRCVGIGRCRKHREEVMCPSYMATREEAHSTRGRAHLLFEMTRGEVITDGWRSAEVHDALDLCLACKACKHECPVDVDMADYKAEFMHQHYMGRLRPRSAYAMGLIWWWARAAAAAPGLTNALSHTAPFAELAKWLGGFAPQREIPRFASPTFRRVRAIA